MTSKKEQEWLRSYAANRYQGAGEIVDLGCFLGATTISLAEGLALNPRAKQKRIHAFDLFVWMPFYEEWTKERGADGLLIEGNSFLPEFLRRTERWKDYISIHPGDLRQVGWEGGPIELLFVDAMKNPAVATTIAANFFPNLLLRRSYLAHQDFSHAFTPWIHFLTFRLRDHFHFVEDLPQSSLFRLEKEIDPSLLTRDLAPAAVSPEEIEAAFDYSISIVAETKRANVVAAKAMAYLHRGEPSRAHEVMAMSPFGPASLRDELNVVKRLIEQNLAERKSPYD